MRIRNVRSGISDEPEEEPPKPLRAKIAYWLYILLLLGIVALGVWYGVVQYSSYDGRGHIRVDRNDIQAQRDGRLDKIFHAQGDTVEAGTPLFRVDPGAAAACDPSNRLELLQIRNEIRTDQLLLEQAQQRLNRFQTELEQVRERSALELQEELGEQKRLQENIFETRQEIDRLQDRIQRNQEEAGVVQNQTDQQDPQCIPYTVPAPRDGVVRQVHESTFAFVRSGTTIMSIAPTPVSAAVYAYLDTELQRYIRTGDTLTVRLPGDVESTGVIRRTYSSALEFRDVKYDVYRPHPSEVLVEIDPVGPQTNDRWQTLDRMDVTVQGRLGTARLFSSPSTSSEVDTSAAGPARGTSSSR